MAEQPRDLVAVYEGAQMDAIRVQLTLGAHDIPADAQTFTLDERGVRTRVYVDRVDVERARAVLDQSERR